MRSLLKAGWAAAFGAMLVFGNLSTAAAQQLDEASELNNRVMDLYSAGRYSDAIPLAQRALVLREKAFGRDHPAVAQSLNNLAQLYEGQDHYAQAEPLYQRSLAIYEKALGPDHPEVAT